MLCKRCNVALVTGTTYKMVNKMSVSKRFVECPICHYKAYMRGINPQVIKIR